MRTQLALTLLILTLPYLAQAQLLPFFKNLQKKSKQEQTQKCASNITDENQSSPNYKANLARQCALEICGAPKNSPSAFLIPSNIRKYSKEKALTEFEKIKPLVEEALAEQSKSNEALALAVQEKLKDGKLSFNFEKWEDIDYEVSSDKMFEDKIVLSIDHNKELSKRFNYSIPNKESYSPMLQLALEEYIIDKTKQLNTTPSLALAQGIYAEYEAVKIVQQLWEDYEKNFKSFRPKDKELKADYKEVKLAGTKYIHELEMTSLISLAELIEEKNRILYYQKEGKYPPAVSLCKTTACRLGIQESYNKINFQEEIDDLLKENRAPKNKENYLAYCQSSFANHYLKKNKDKKFAKEIPEIIEQFKKTITSRLSSQTQKKINDYLDKELKFTLRHMRDYSENPIFDIRYEYDRMKENKVDNYKDLYREQNNKELADNLLNFREQGSIDPNLNLDICIQGFDAIITDYFMPGKNKISISLFSKLQPEYGRSVVSHEMGHALSYFIDEDSSSEESYNQYLLTRTCISSHHKNASPLAVTQKPRHDDDTFFTEEDMADFISYTANINNPVITECSLLSPSADGESYPYATLELKEGDSHSPPLLRVLQESAVKGREIPKSCAELKELYKGQYSFYKCEL